MNEAGQDELRRHVRNRYKQIAVESISHASCCSPNPASSGCCGTADEVSAKLGYSSEELSAVPEGANLGLGCGNPQTIASLKLGETVLDLGSGAGFDCFLAARQVGETGKVYGVDMTPEMVSRARSHAAGGGYTNVEFRLGEIEHLPVADSAVDVIISNCVINLSPDKQNVFHEAFRVLKPGGRLAISDIVTTAALPKEIKADLDALASCISGASAVDEVKQLLERSGFENIVVELKGESRQFMENWVPGAHMEDFIQSATIKAIKP